jgi:hypothetical protein
LEIAAMKVYTVEAPDGKILQIEGPEGASEEEVIAQARRLYQPQATARPQPRGEMNYSQKRDFLQSGGKLKPRNFLQDAGAVSGAILDVIPGARDVTAALTTATDPRMWAGKLTPSQAFSSNREAVESQQRSFQQQHPYATTALQTVPLMAATALAPEVVLPAQATKASQTATIGGRALRAIPPIARGATAAGAYGAAQGLGSSGSPEDRLAQATANILPYATVGAAIPAAVAAAPEAVGAVRSVGQRIGEQLANRNLTAEEQAARYAAGLMQRTGSSIESMAQNPIAEAGKPITAAEMMGPGGVNAAAALARQQGSTAGEALGAIGRGSPRVMGRNERILNDAAEAAGVHPEAARGNIMAYSETKRAEAKPLYEKAYEGGSTAPLTQQFENQYEEASKIANQAALDVQAAERANLQAAAARSRAGQNVYLNAGASDQEKAAKTAFEEAQKRAETARAAAEAIKARMRQAQTDGSANVRGAVWTPRLQQFLDLPEIKMGLKEGMRLERIDAVTEGKRFNPSEYAIVGEAPNGEPIVGAVPNMRLLDMAKRGLDRQIEAHTDSLTGRVDSLGRSLARAREQFLAEIDTLNPDYRAARAVGGDYLTAEKAYREGNKELFDTRVSSRDVQEKLSKSTQEQKEAYKGGLINNIYERLNNNALNLDALRTSAVREKLTSAFQSPQKANDFITKIEHEITLRQNERLLNPNFGSQTAPLSEEMAAQRGERDNLGRQVTEFAIESAKSGPLKAAGAAALRKLLSAVDAASMSGALSQEARDIVGKALLESDTKKIAELLKKYEGMKK